MPDDPYASDPRNATLIDEVSDAYDLAEGLLLSESANPPDLLFHYTDSRGLLGIIENKEVFATHHAFLNDPLEIRFTQQAFIDFARNYGDFGGKFADQLVQRFRFDTWWADDLRVDLYVACFSVHRDLLSQWRAYSASGSGFSLGLDVRHVPEIVEGEGVASAVLRRTIYDKRTQDRVLLSFFTPAIQAANKAIIAGLPEQRVLNELWRRANLLSVHCNCSFKQSGYMEEEEWRLVLFKPTEVHNRDIRHVSFRERRGQLVPYIKCPLRLATELKEVVVGPANGELHIRAATEMLLHAKNLDSVRIANSATSLRA